MNQIEVYKNESRGQADHGWLKTHYTFSFANYYNPSRMGFGALRVINDDMIAPAAGFPAHSHDNMEIITIPLEGALEHQDSGGNKAVVTAEEVQMMSAGTGVTHSEYNHSQTEQVGLLQIWVMPKKMNINPRYDQKKFPAADRKNKFQTIASPLGTSDEGIKLNQDAYFTRVDLDAHSELSYRLKLPGNGIFAFLLEGSAQVGGKKLSRRDALAGWEIDELKIYAEDDAQLLIIEVPE